MDPFGVVYAVLSIVQVAQQVYTLINKLEDTSIKVNTLRFRMLNEKERTEIWASRIRFAISEGSNPIPEEKVATVEDIKNQLLTYQNLLRKQLETLNEKGADRMRLVLSGR